MRNTTKITQSITNRDSESFDKYLKDINPKGLISQEREIELAKLIKQGNQRAKNELIEANLRFVVSISKQYLGRGLDISDLVSEGNIGLITAAKKFDPSRNIKFISYAVWWIRQSILQSLADNSRTIRLPLNQIGGLNKIKSCYSQLEQKLGRAPEPSELAESLGIDESKINQTLLASKSVSSLDNLIFDDSDSMTLVDTIDSGLETDILCQKESDKIMVDSLLNRLNSRERIVIEHLFGLNQKIEMSVSEISHLLGVGSERVRQIKTSALKKLSKCQTIR